MNKLKELEKRSSLIRDIILDLKDISSTQAPKAMGIDYKDLLTKRKIKTRVFFKKDNEYLIIFANETKMVRKIALLIKSIEDNLNKISVKINPKLKEDDTPIVKAFNDLLSDPNIKISLDKFLELLLSFNQITENLIAVNSYLYVDEFTELVLSTTF